VQIAHWVIGEVKVGKILILGTKFAALVAAVVPDTTPQATKQTTMESPADREVELLHPQLQVDQVRQVPLLNI
jgi:hypothetical protein